MYTHPCPRTREHGAPQHTTATKLEPSATPSRSSRRAEPLGAHLSHPKPQLLLGVSRAHLSGILYLSLNNQHQVRSARRLRCQYEPSASFNADGLPVSDSHVRWERKRRFLAANGDDGGGAGHARARRR